ncbi:hypothetical protein V490_07753 [Pseudogymnoascus sp. VKM F-3557]|nr:hypothetical protein V490_07753 [Pseudogymnoascus sp. VKM F-3557]
MSTSYSNSNLSSARYGYDFVVATTQISINAILLQFLSEIPEPTVTACYVYDRATATTVPIDYSTLIQEANGTDPFKVPDGSDPNTDQDLKNLEDVLFVGAFQATIGLPAGVNVADLPDLVTLGSNSQVQFNLLCSDFTVVGFSGSIYDMSWLNQSQTPQTLWTFASNVDMRLSPYQDSYSNLPPAVQAELKNLSGTAFSVQQLFFDLDNAGLWSTPTIPNIPPSSALYNLLDNTFIDKYFTQMQTSGQPLLGIGVVVQTPPTASLDLTNLNFEVSLYVDQNGEPYSNPTTEQQQMSTLNYLCATDNNSLPPPVPFTWNWVDLADQSNFDGVISINRNAFAAYLTAPILAFAMQYCIQPQSIVGIDYDKWSGYEYPVFSCTLQNNQTPTVTPQSTGSNVMSVNYTSQPSDAKEIYPMGKGELIMSSTYSMTMEFVGSQVIITQEQTFYVSITDTPASKDGNMIDTTITDTYSLFIDETGKLGSSVNSTTSNNPTFPKISPVVNQFTGIGDIANDINNSILNFQGGQLTDFPLAPFQNFVFPGGNTFAFKSVQFSDNQDLVTPITYQDPSAPAAVVPKLKVETPEKEIRICSIYADK